MWHGDTDRDCAGVAVSVDRAASAVIALAAADLDLSSAVRYPVDIPELNSSSVYPWLAALAQRYPELSAQFRAAFLAGDSAPGAGVPPRIVLGLGSRLTFEIVTSADGVTIRARRGDRLVSEHTQRAEFADGHYAAMFAALSELSRDLTDLPLLGGWHCVTRPSRHGLVCRFTVPRIIIRSADHGFEIISFEGRIELPGVDECAPPGWWQPPRARSATNIPEFATYRANLDAVLRALRSDRLSKVVISRKVDVELEHEPEPLALVTAVSARHLRRYSYSFRWDDGPEWLGVSPETLLRKRGSLITADALAGTRPVPADPAVEATVRAELLRDAKENFEHQQAVRLLVDDLEPLCGNTLRLGANMVPIRTPYAYHIKSEISGQVEPDVGVFDVLARTYPPATIWGRPRAAAAELLRHAEPFDREFFAGGFGYCAGMGTADFALAIRTARLERNQLSVFAGGGIVADSVIEREWEECAVKMTPFFQVLEMDRSRL